MRKLIALFVSGILILLSTTGCGKKNNTDLNSAKAFEESYMAVDGSLNSVLYSENYETADQESRRQLILQALQSSDCEKYIQSGSVHTEDAEYISFKYLNGTECIVDLNDESADGTLGGMPSYSDFWFLDDQNTLQTYGEKLERFPWQIAEIESPYNEGDKKALLIDGLGFTDVSYNLEENVREWSKCHLQTTHAFNFTVDDFKTKLAGYDYVNISCHGVHPDNTPRIQTDEDISREGNAAYSLDMTAGRVALYYSQKLKKYIINPGFFQYYYKGGKLKDTIVWLGSCYGLENEKLAEDLMTAGTKFLIGPDGVNMTSYDELLQIYFMYQLFSGKEVFEALNFAKDKCQSLWEKVMDGVQIKAYHTDRVYLFTLTDEAKEKWKRASEADVSPVSGYVTDVSGNPIEGANVCPQYFVNGEWKNADNVFTDKNGRYSFELENDTYRIVVKADGYYDYESKEYEITATMDSEGNRFEFLIDTVKLEEITKVPDIVQTVFENTALWHQDALENAASYDEQKEYFWFQDIDMDGTVEFITGPAISGAHACYRFCIWSAENGQLKRVPYIYDSDQQDNALMMWHNYSELIDAESPAPINSFLLQLAGKDGKFWYTYTSQDGDASSSTALIYEFDCAARTIKELFSITQGGNGTEYRVESAAVSPAEFKSRYEQYTASLQPYDTSVVQLNYGDYSAMSDEQKKDMLLTSYNAWSYHESQRTLNLGMNSAAAKIADTSSGNAQKSDGSPEMQPSGNELTEYLGKDLSACYALFGENSIRKSVLVGGSVSEDNYDIYQNGNIIGNIAVDGQNKITMISMQSRDFTVYGIRTGDSVESAIAKLEDLGIKQEDGYVYDYDDDGIMNHCHLNNGNYVNIEIDGSHTVICMLALTE